MQRSNFPSKETVVACRSISDFFGKGVVIGCSHNHIHCSKKDLHQPDAFYTIDINSKQNPDFTFDITEELPPGFNNRFQLTLLEHLDCVAYNKSRFKLVSIWGADKPGGEKIEMKTTTTCSEEEQVKGEKGFKNIRAMTDTDGFILIVGSPRSACYRKSYNHLNYIEFSSEIVLIPNNQEMSIQQIHDQIHNLDESLQNTINAVTNFKNIPVQDLKFCKIELSENIAMDAKDTAENSMKINQPQINTSSSHDSSLFQNFLIGAGAVAVLIGIGVFAKKYCDNTMPTIEAKGSNLNI